MRNGHNEIQSSFTERPKTLLLCGCVVRFGQCIFDAAVTIYKNMRSTLENLSLVLQIDLSEVGGVLGAE